MEPTQTPPITNTQVVTKKNKFSSTIIFIAIIIAIVGISTIVFYIMKTYQSQKLGSQNGILTITLFPTICTKDYAPLPDIPFRNSFDNLYYGQVNGTIQRIDKDEKNKILNLYIKTPHALYIFPVSLLSPHNTMYDLKTHQSFPITNITENRSVSMAFSCTFDQPNSISITATVK